MNALLEKLGSRAGRKYLYLVAIAVVALLVRRQIVDAGEAGLWIALATALLALPPTVALRNLPPKSSPAKDADPLLVEPPAVDQ